MKKEQGKPYGVRYQKKNAEENTGTESDAVKNLEDGEYSIQVDLEGGSGKAGISSPTPFEIRDGLAYAELQWSSPNYDYMIVNGKKYLPVNEEG